MKHKNNTTKHLTVELQLLSHGTFIFYFFLFTTFICDNFSNVFFEVDDGIISLENSQVLVNCFRKLWKITAYFRPVNLYEPVQMHGRGILQCFIDH